MDVLFYLKELLNTNKTISIAGIGTLYKKKFPGKYDIEKHTFVPPSYKLNFTSEINESEDLANFIAQEENIDIDSAKLKIREFSEKIHNQLTKEKQFTLTGFGKIILENNELTFLNDEHNDLGDEFYGFQNLDEIIDPIHKTADVIEVEVNSINEEKSQLLESESELENKENQLKYIGKPFTPNYDYDDNPEEGMSKTVKILLRTLLVITIISAIVGLAYFFNPVFFDNTIRDTSNEVLNTDLSTSNDSLKTAENQLNIDTSSKTNLDSSSIAKEQFKKTIITIDSNITTYEVIGSAEKSQKRIDFVINTMKRRGIEAKALENIPGKLIKISLGSFTNLAIAKKYKDSLRKKLNNPEIYIQTIKPKK